MNQHGQLGHFGSIPSGILSVEFLLLSPPVVGSDLLLNPLTLLYMHSERAVLRLFITLIRIQSDSVFRLA